MNADEIFGLRDRVINIEIILQFDEGVLAAGFTSPTTFSTRILTRP